MLCCVWWAIPWYRYIWAQWGLSHLIVCVLACLSINWRNFWTRGSQFCSQLGSGQPAQVSFSITPRDGSEWVSVYMRKNKPTSVGLGTARFQWTARFYNLPRHWRTTRSFAKQRNIALSGLRVGFQVWVYGHRAASQVYPVKAWRVFHRGQLFPCTSLGNCRSFMAVSYYTRGLQFLPHWAETTHPPNTRSSDPNTREVRKSEQHSQHVSLVQNNGYLIAT